MDTVINTTKVHPIIEQLMLKNRNFCSTDYDASLSLIDQFLPIKIHEYNTSNNYWEIPPKWDLKQAWIKTLEGKLIYEVDHPLKIIGLSKPFEGIVTQKQLLQHLHYDHRYDNAIPYHFRQFYRPWERTWGFCVPKTLINELDQENYQVSIQVQESEGLLKVAEHYKQGHSPFCFAFVAHLDHPGMMNDDLAGVAVGLEVFKRLAQKKTKFSYKLVLVPEIIGSEFYLSRTCDKNKIVESCFLEMLATKTPLALQKSLSEQTMLESIFMNLLAKKSHSTHIGNFKDIICNDEYVWEAHQVPMCSLSRFPYPEYHTHLDNLSIYCPDAFEEAVNLLLKTIEKLEERTLIEKKFSGVPCLSHPDLNLYIDPGQVAFGTQATKDILQMRKWVDIVFAQKKHFWLEKLCEEHRIPLLLARNYLSQWAKKGLVHIW